MKKRSAKMSSKSGKPAGTLMHIGERKRDEASVTVIKYNESDVIKKNISLSELLMLEIDNKYKWWIAVDGLHDLDLVEAIGKKFKISRFVLENAVNTAVRPNIEIYKDYSFLITKKIYLGNNKKVEYEQVSMITGHNYLITLTENGLDDFNNIYERLRSEANSSFDINYLSYLILDSIIDNYFFVMEDISDRMEDVETGIIDNPNNEALQNIHLMKKELLLIHKAVWPQREVISTILREHNSFSSGEMHEYFRDVQEHLFQIVDMIEVFRDMLSNMLDVYLSSTSRRMNEIIMILTIISTIFIPITFVAGIYGMNFRYMPELGVKYGYPAALGIMALITIGMIVFFKRKKWM